MDAPIDANRRGLLALGLAGVAALAVPGCAIVASGSRSESGSPEPRQQWQRVLETHVDSQGRVAFTRLAAQREDLDHYVAWVNGTDPRSHPALFPSPAHVLAYHLNAYNALAMHAIVEDGIPATLAGLKKVEFFLLKRVRVGGRATSLYDYENKVIRRLGDPRIHFALNCMSVGCPRLPREPFDAARVDAQLERETRSFFGEARNARVDHAKREIWLSEILSFFPEDFLAVAPSLPAYVDRYREPALPRGYAVRFTPYDWTVNRQPAPTST